MTITLEAVAGPAIGQSITLTQPGTVRVGRAGDANLATSDRYMSRIHFQVEYDGNWCWIQDLDSRNGTAVNGIFLQGPLLVSDGDIISCGKTEFLVSKIPPAAICPVRQAQRRIVSESLPTQSIAVESTAKAAPFISADDICLTAFPPARHPLDLIRVLRRSEPLYAVLDAARDPKVLEILHQYQDKYQSLYEGVKGDGLAPYAPYLVRLSADSPLLELLVQEGWGRAWGVFLTCNAPFSEVRRHLRHFLMVHAPDGRQLYFRFYDPRVLRSTLSLFASDEAVNFFGVIRTYLMEGDHSQLLLQFSITNEGVDKIELPVVSPPAPTPSQSLTASG